MSEWRYYGSRISDLPETNRQIYPQYFPSGGKDSMYGRFSEIVFSQKIFLIWNYIFLIWKFSFLDDIYNPSTEDREIRPAPLTLDVQPSITYPLYQGLPKRVAEEQSVNNHSYSQVSCQNTILSSFNWALIEV